MAPRKDEKKSGSASTRKRPVPSTKGSTKGVKRNKKTKVGEVDRELNEDLPMEGEEQCNERSIEDDVETLIRNRRKKQEEVRRAAELEREKAREKAIRAAKEDDEESDDDEEEWIEEDEKEYDSMTSGKHCGNVSDEANKEDSGDDSDNDGSDEDDDVEDEEIDREGVYRTGMTSQISPRTNVVKKMAAMNVTPPGSVNVNVISRPVEMSEKQKKDAATVEAIAVKKFVRLNLFPRKKTIFTGEQLEVTEPLFAFVTEKMNIPLKFQNDPEKIEKVKQWWFTWREFVRKKLLGKWHNVRNVLFGKFSAWSNYVCSSEGKFPVLKAILRNPYVVKKKELEMDLVMSSDFTQPINQVENNDEGSNKVVANKAFIMCVMTLMPSIVGVKKWKSRGKDFKGDYREMVTVSDEVMLIWILDCYWNEWIKHDKWKINNTTLSNLCVEVLEQRAYHYGRREDLSYFARNPKRNEDAAEMKGIKKKYAGITDQGKFRWNFHYKKVLDKWKENSFTLFCDEFQKEYMKEHKDKMTVNSVDYNNNVGVAVMDDLVEH